MSRLEDISAGKYIRGIIHGGLAEVLAVKWHGDSAVEIAYKDSSGRLDSQLMYRDYDGNFEVIDKNILWNFGSNGWLLKLSLEAYRMKSAYIFDPYLAVHISDIEPLPHQISAVYHKMLTRLPLRYVLADDPGAGKTIMAGLFIKELVIRGDIKRCLIVSPGSLAEQWQEELSRKFRLKFDILTNENAANFTEINFLIARLDKLSRSEYLQQKIHADESKWDLIVIDEAHKMSAAVYANDKTDYTKRFRLGRLLSKHTRHFLLLTATPHNGKNNDFNLFMSLIDSDRFGLSHSNNPPDVSDVMRWLVKEDLLKFDGTPLFPERTASTVSYNLSPIEAQLYNAVTDYIRNEFNRADRLGSRQRNTVGFALTILQRRLASSPEAIYQSLKRRIDRLSERLNEEKFTAQNEAYIDDDYDPDENTSAEEEALEENLAVSASASTTIRELEAEIETLRTLSDMAGKVRSSGKDRKWQELSSLLQDNSLMFTNAKRQKLIIFTEHKDTLHYLADKIRSLMGNSETVITIHGGMSRTERKNAESSFRNNDNAAILIATDAAGEGINLQCAHLMVNYDLPWNPNRIEQRFGRIHRIGQNEICHLWNLVAIDTREGSVYHTLLTKLEREREALGGKVFDILGKLTFNNAPLRDLLIQAIRFGNDPERQDKLSQTVDSSLDREHIIDLIRKHALTQDIIDAVEAANIRSDMDRSETRKLQPHSVKSFFIEAFRHLGGTISPRGNGLYEISHVPAILRKGSVQRKYERVSFDRNSEAVLIAPGHPLFEAVTDSILAQNSAVLKSGSVLIDENDSGTTPRLLFALEHSIRDGIGNIISRRIHFTEIYPDGSAHNAGDAPHIDYIPAEPDEHSAILNHVKAHDIFPADIEDIAANYAVSEIIPAHSEDVKARKLAMLAKTERAVKSRLADEIYYRDSKAIDLRQKEEAGKFDRDNTSKKAQETADELHERMKARLAEIEQEKNISSLPPVIITAALIIPKGLRDNLAGKISDFHQDGRKRVESLAMNTVIQAEIQQGYSPRDVSEKKCGYDIESVTPSGSLRFIEVKGRAKGAETVTVSANEILTAVNKPGSFVLALAEVDNDKVSRLVYLRQPFTSPLDISAVSANFSIRNLIRNSQVIYEK